MNSGVITLVVSGPVPGSPYGDAESTTALIRELHARTILHVARPGAGDDVAGGPTLLDAGESTALTGRPDPLGRKGGVAPLAELVVTGLFSATTVAALAQVTVAFVQRGAARRITLRDGRRTLTISSASEETERMVVEWFGTPPTQSGARPGAD